MTEKSYGERGGVRSKKAHYVIIVLLFVSNLVALGLHIRMTKFEIIGEVENPFPLIDISRSFIAQEHFLTTLQPLRESLLEIVEDAEKDKRISVYVEFLNTGANISINPTTDIWPASLAKIPLALAVMKKVERGEWKLSNELVLLYGDADSNSGDAYSPLSEHPIGTRFTIQALLQELLTNSDNTAYFILKRNLHEDELNQVFQDLGLEDLFNEEGRVSAKEYSRLLRSLYVSSFLTRGHSQMLLELLDASTYNDLLASSIPQEVPFPHKYGENIDLNVFSDSGIVYLKDRPYLITVMIEANQSLSWSEAKREAVEIIGKISASAYEYFSEQ